MKFKQGSRRKAIDYEKELVQYWKQHKTFEKSVGQRPADDAFVFYDGPPFITGVPHHGTLLTSIVKDAVPRYWTMKGKHVERVWGWDCHGLPAEVFTEKKLGINDKRDIGTKVSLVDYITTCRENMVQTGSLWEDTIDRIGRWVDFKGAYKTMDKPYMESVWWAFKRLYEDGKIYEGEKVLLYCTRDATPISKAEVAMDNSYQDVTDPSVFVKFRLLDDNATAKPSVTDKDSVVQSTEQTTGNKEMLKNSVDQKTSKFSTRKELAEQPSRYLLAWTTTPWTLPANTAVAVNEAEDYSEVELDVSEFHGQPVKAGERLILATSLLDKVLTDEKNKIVPYTTIRTMKGKELVGNRYQPLFEDHGERAHRVWHADYVSLDEGTGVVHLAPAYGEEDYQLSREKNFPFVNVIDDNGFYNEGKWKNQYVWDINKPIAKELHENSVVLKISYIRHSYPHCHRCGTKLMYRAHPSWFMDIEGQRTEMLEQNSHVNWFPSHIKYGRSEKTLQSAPDWNLSRDRFWATAMPVWKGTDSQGRTHVKVVGSYAELKELSGVELEDYHRPWIDDVTFTIDGVEYRRIEKVLDCWFESGSMPFAQFHYPFENTEKFEQNFPGDFIVEYVPQVRAWFYYMSAVNVGLFGKVPFKTALVHGTIAGNDGRKMSKSFGNYTDPNELMDKYSADALRFLLLSSPLLNGEDFSLQDKEVADIQRKLAMVWNMYDFFTMYADVDGWEWDGKLADPTEADGAEASGNPLDQWIVSRVHQLTKHIDEHMQRYDIPNALAEVLPFLDDASNWYVRRSRRRFWKSGKTADKQAAYRTLHYVLTRFAIIVAPFTPFMAEELFQKLTGGQLGESVHLLDWPEAGQVNELVIDRMAYAREVIQTGLSQRAQAGIKVRQPLTSLSIKGAPKLFEEAEQDYISILEDELNVKAVQVMAAGPQHQVELDLTLTPDLRREGMMREIIRHVQSARKAAGLNVDDRIRLGLVTDNAELNQAITEHHKTITAETLAAELITDGVLPEAGYSQELKVEGQVVNLALAPAAKMS